MFDRPSQNKICTRPVIGGFSVPEPRTSWAERAETTMNRSPGDPKVMETRAVGRTVPDAGGAVEHADKPAPPETGALQQGFTFA